MRALVFIGPREASVQDVDAPVAGPGEVVVDVIRAGVCGTDAELFSGEMPFFEQGLATWPLRPGHEWCGTVASVGAGVDAAWLGRTVMGDTFLGCGHCDLCLGGHHNACPDRYEVGVRGGWPGALAEQVRVPVSSLHVVPTGMDAAAGALVEPGGNGLRAVELCEVREGQRILVLGTATIGLLTGLFALARGAEVHLVGRREAPIAFARTLGLHASTEPPSGAAGYRSGDSGRWDAVIDATNSPDAPARAIDLVAPGGRVALVGISGAPSLVDSRNVLYRDVTVHGVLGGSASFARTIELFALPPGSGGVDPLPVVGMTVGLDEVPAVLAGELQPPAGAGPKVLVDPTR